MIAATLLSDLRRRGVELTAEGDHLRYRAPRGTLQPADLEELRAHKLSLLDVLREDVAKDLAGAPIAETRSEDVGAVRVESPRFGPVWIGLTPGMADEIRAEEAQRSEPRPVLLTDDIAALRGKSEAAVRAALEVARAFPGARVV